MSLPTPKKIEIELPENTQRERPDFKDIILDGRGVPRIANTASNLKTLGTYHGMDFRFNMLSFDLDICDIHGRSLVASNDELRSDLISAGSIHGLPKAAIDDHLIAVCQKNKYHPIRDYLNSGEWDGVARVEAVIECVNAKHSEIAQIVLKRWLVGAVASLYEDSFKSKLVPVLQGDQSFKKTAFVERIAQINPQAFLGGAELNPDNKDSMLSCIRHFIVELGELERTSKNSQGSLKAFLTKSIDTVRPPYGRNDIKKPRQTSFIATVNGNEFLKDETGSTRFAVIEMAEPANMEKLNSLLGWYYDGTGSIKQTNPELLRQFWLEVKTMYEQGEGWQLTGEESTKVSLINSNFNDNGSWYNYILGAYIHNDSRFCIEGWFTAGDFVKAEVDCSARDTAMIGKALKKLAQDGYIATRKAGGNKTLYCFNLTPEKGEPRYERK